MIYGFDVSSMQGAHPFDQIARAMPELEFVIIRGQVGNDNFDPDFEANAKASFAAGLVPFMYCYAYPLPAAAGHPGRDPMEQARLFVAHAQRYPEFAKRPLFLDFEFPEPQDWAKWGCTAASIAAWMLACCEEIERLMGVAPVIYTYPDWWQHVAAADVSWAARFALWLARYLTPGSRPTQGQSPALIAPWLAWLFWQFDGTGGLRLPNGVDADFCCYNGTKDELLAFAAAA